MNLSSIKIKLLVMAALFVLLLAQPMLNSANAGEMAERDEIDSTVKKLLANRDFTELEKIAKSFLNDGAHTSSGLWKIGLYDGAILDAFHCECSDESFWNRADENLRDWIRQYPESINAHLAYAHMLLEKAWSVRGWGYANTVAPANWRPFLEQVERTPAYLMEHKEIRISDPRWNYLIVDIANLQKIPEIEYEALVGTALDRHPDYYPMYFNTMLHYEPKWGGSAEAIEKFARESVTRSRSREGEGMYARICWYASQSLYGNNLFQSSSVDWLEMKQGIDDVLKAFPDQWTINNFAKFACFARGKEKTKELIDQVSSAFILDAWGDYTIFENCKTWARAE